jgi:heme/copper-type cytochrome/quinol oxidase subunit 3
MIRPVLTELALFLTPFVIYAAFLMVTRRGAWQPSAWTLRRLALLAIASLVLVLGSLLLLAQFSVAPPGSTYVPAHIEGGKFVPGTTR